MCAYGITRRRQEVKRFCLGVGELQVTSVKFIAREKWIVAGTSYGLIYLFSYDPLQQIRVVKAHSGSVNSLAIHPNEPYVLSASFGGDVQLRDYEEDMEIIESFSARNWCARCVVFDPSGATFANACGDLIKMWNVDSGECKLILSGHSHEVTCLEYFTREDELYLISGSQDRTAKIWDCQTGRCVKTLQAYSPVRAVCSHPDLPILITGSYDGSLRLWNSTSFRRERIMKFDVGGVKAIACLKGSTRIVIGHAGGLGFAEIGPG